MLAGPNGAGKSTLYEAVIKPKIKAPFINADLIQRDELKNPSMESAYQAAEIAEQRRREHLEQKKSFVSESTFSHPSKLSLIHDAKNAGFAVVLYHVNVRTPDLSVMRVSHRNATGGHNVPEDKIRERYERNQPLIREAVKAADRAFVYDNSRRNRAPELALAFKKGQVIHASENVPAWCRSLYSQELKKFSLSRLNPAASSFLEIKEIAGKDANVRIPNPNIKNYSGQIVGESSLHYLQRKSDGELVAHFKSVFDKPLKMGQTATISYSGRHQATALPPSEKVAEKPVKTSFEEAKEAAQKVGLKGSFPAPDKSYSGVIIAETGLHVVQKVTDSTATIHTKQNLRRTPKVGENLEIRYKNGFAKHINKVSQSKGIKR